MILPNQCCCCDPSPPPADEYLNVTKVDDYAETPDPAGIDPYPRPWNEAGIACIKASEPTATCGEPGLPVCYNQGFDGTPIVSDGVIGGIKTCTPSDLVSQIADNCYSKTGNKVSFREPCKRQGWKGVQAHAVWPGRFGFVNSGVSCCPTGGQEQSKYMTVSHIETASFSTISIGTPIDGHTKNWSETYEHSFQQTTSVDGNGNITRSGEKNASLVTDFSGFWSEFDSSYGERTEDAYDCESGEHTGRGGFLIAPAGDYVYPTEAGTIGGIIFGAPPGPSPLNASCGKFQPSNKTAAELNAEFSFVPGMDFYTTIDVGGEQKEWQRYTILDSDTTGYALSDNELKLKFSGTAQLHYFFYEGDGSVSGENTITYSWDYSLVITLSDEITFSSVLDDAIALLGEFPLNNDAIYPWRTDGKTWLQPIVTRDAAATEPTINWAVDEDCEFLDEVYYTGAVRGAPLPAGYGRHFDFHHIVWGKTNNGLGICSGCELYLGELSAAPVPIGATAWTDRVQGAANYGPGAHVSQILDASYSSGSPGMVPIQGVMMQKWAETLESWPSVNFARACGHDRYLRDETAVACIIDFTEPDLIIASDPVVEFEVDDILGLPEGIYQVTGKTDAFNYTLTKLGDLPGSITYDGAAKLRFPDARGICGILPVTASQDGGYVSIRVPEDHWLRTGDIVDFKNVDGLGSGVTVTVTGEKTFSVAGTLGDYDGNGYVVSAGVTSALWNWHSTCSRHEFLLREWQSQYREAHDDPETPGNTFVESTQSLAPLAGHPSVLVISPNAGDTFTNMYQQTWDNEIISADHCFGQEWHMDFLQAVVDPFWQADHEPCGHSGAWSQAGVPCGEDEDHYQYPPLVEPRLTKPEGAPDIPVTLYYGGSAMPQGVGTPPCGASNMHLPNEKAPIHAIRSAWESCNDWKIRVNARCPAPNVDI